MTSQASLSLSLSQKSLTHNIGSASALPIIILFYQYVLCNSSFTYVTVHLYLVVSQLHTRFSTGAHVTYRCFLV